MNAEQKVGESLPNKAAVACGRIVFFCFAMMAIPIMLAYGGLQINDPIEWLCIAVGILIVISGALLPPKIVANFGFNLPIFLPDDD